MRVFLSEYLTSGAGLDGLEKASLATEGAAMLRALARDAVAVPGWQVSVTWDANLEPPDIPGAEIYLASSADEERRLFEQLTAAADVTLVIAPEFDRLLEERGRLVADCGGRFAGSTAEAISLCGDKLALARHLLRHSVPTIETRQCAFDILAEELRETSSDGCVVKPRCGAGAVNTFHVRSPSDVAEASAAYCTGALDWEPLVQPFVPGRAVSIAGIVADGDVELFPVCDQRIAGTTRLHYAGGSVPAATETGRLKEIEIVARQAIAAIPGLAGYVGIDLMLPEKDSDNRGPVIVEINPRLTSSYHGYRRLAKTNLAQRIIDHAVRRPAVEWRTGQVDFLTDGTSSAREPTFG